MPQEIKMVCFDIAGEKYALDIDQVLGINPMMKIIRVPDLPGFVEGIVRVKGKIIPIIDLKKRFSSEQSDPGKYSRIIIGKASGTRVGIIVDAVLGVIDIPTERIEPPTSVLSRVKFLKGVGNAESGPILLLDMDKILNLEEAQALAGINRKTK